MQHKTKDERKESAVVGDIFTSKSKFACWYFLVDVQEVTMSY